MSNVFVSHSSIDKPFVRRLATSLLAQGFPVWLDSWRLELGDSLLDKIYDAIDESSVVIIVVSTRSVESGWVNRELNAALVKEASTGRKFLIPIIIDGCSLPLKIVDRLYADFSNSFSEPLEKLAGVLRNLGCHKFTPPKSRELVPLNFSQEVNLDITSFYQAIDHITRRQNGLDITESQIVINDDIEYETLRKKLHSRIDRIQSDAFFSANLERSLRRDLNKLAKLEATLISGVCLLANNHCSVDTVYWFTKIVRARCAYLLYSVQIPDSSDLLTYGSKWDCAYFNSHSGVCRFFEVEEAVSTVSIYNTVQDIALQRYFRFQVASKELANLKAGVPISLREICYQEVINKFIYPQMTLQFIERGNPPIIWDINHHIISKD